MFDEGSVRRQETEEGRCLVKIIEPCLLFAKRLDPIGNGKESESSLVLKPELHPRDLVIRNQFLYSFKHINGFNFSFSLSTCNLFDGAPTWKLRASGMHEL